jgi:Domain of unknown function (DUF4281)
MRAARHCFYSEFWILASEFRIASCIFNGLCVRGSASCRSRLRFRPFLHVFHSYVEHLCHNLQMAAEQLFAMCNFIVLPGWLLLVVAPRWRWTQRIAAVALPLALAAVYLTLLILHFHKGEGGFGSLAEVSKLFENPHLLLAGWIHYLAFDLFTGAWQVRDSERLRIAHAYVVPCLLLTFLFGPAGLLTWFLIRISLRGRSPVV